MSTVSKGKPGNRKTKSNQPHPLQVRTSDKVREDLTKAANAGGRSLAKEIERRLEASLVVPASPADDPTVFGWSNPTRARTLADAFGVLVGDILDYSADETDLPATLGIIAFAATEFLAGLGASADVTDEQKAQARLSAQQVLRKINRAGSDPTAFTRKPEMAAYAALAQAWLAASFNTKTDDPNGKE